MNEKIKVYTIKLNGKGVWTTDNPENFREKLEAFKSQGKIKMNVNSIIQWVKDLGIGEGLSINPISIECSEILEDKYLIQPYEERG